MTEAKICGITDPENLQAAVSGGARFIGFVFYPPSPRIISPAKAALLARMLPTGVRAVGLFVNPDNEFLDDVLGAVGLDMIQLHGHETPERVQAIKARTSLPVIKAIRIKDTSDLAHVQAYESVSDWILCDSKPDHALLPGGTGHRFDWSLLAGRVFTKPWMLSGGLDSENVAEAIRQLSPTAVDVSSGVEDAPGQKSPAKIKAFLEAVKQKA